MAEYKEGEVETLTSFDGVRAIGLRHGKENSGYVIIPWDSDKEKIKLNIPGETNVKVRPFKSGVAVVSADHNVNWDPRGQDVWETRHEMVTPSGYTIDLKEEKGVDLEECSAVKYARSIYENPSELLKVDKHVDMVSSQIIKAYVDIAKASLEDTLAKAGEEFRRARYQYYNGDPKLSAVEAQYQKTITTVHKLAEKVATKFKKMQQQLDKKSAKTTSGRNAAAQEAIASIFNEPQREI